MILRAAFTIVFFLAINCFSFAQGYKISVRVKGIKDTTCYLAFYQFDKQLVKDTARIDSKGTFTFKGTEKLPGGIYMIYSPARKYFLFEFLVNEQNFSLETDSSDFVKHMKVKGSVENTLFFDYLKFLQTQRTKSDSLQKEFLQAKNKQDSSIVREKLETINKDVTAYKENIINNNPASFIAVLFKAIREVKQPTKEQEEAAKAKGDSLFRYKFYKDHFLENIDFSDDRILRTPIYAQKIKEYLSTLTVPHVDSINKTADFLVEKARSNKELFKHTVIYITVTHDTSHLMGADAVFVHMAEKYYMTNQAFWVDSAILKKITDRAMLLKPLLIGKPAPQLMMADTSGKFYTLQSVKAKYTILYFWDPNCGHCQKETPKLLEVYKQFKAQGVEVFAVNIARDKKRWVEYITKNNLTWLNMYDPGPYVDIRQLYDVYSTPVVYILNEKKEIIAKRLGVEQISEILNNSIKADKAKAQKSGKK